MQSFRNIPTIGASLMINSFASIDDIMRDTLNNTLRVFQTSPPNERHLPYNFASILFNSTPLTPERIDQKIRINPISISGRISIIRSCISSFDVVDRFQKLPLALKIVHSLKNCFININQSDKIAVYSPEKDDLEAKYSPILLKQLKEKVYDRNLIYINGGHQLIEVTARTASDRERVRMKMKGSE